MIQKGFKFMMHVLHCYNYMSRTSRKRSEVARMQAQGSKSSTKGRNLSAASNISQDLGPTCVEHTLFTSSLRTSSLQTSKKKKHTEIRKKKNGVVAPGRCQPVGTNGSQSQTLVCRRGDPGHQVTKQHSALGEFVRLLRRRRCEKRLTHMGRHTN